MVISFLSSRDSAFNQAIRVRLWSIHLGVFAGVLETLMPTEILRLVSKTSREFLPGRLTYLEVMLVRKRVVHSQYLQGY